MFPLQQFVSCGFSATIAILQYFFRASQLSPGEKETQAQWQGGAAGRAVVSTVELCCRFQQLAVVSELHVSANPRCNTDLAIWLTYCKWVEDVQVLISFGMPQKRVGGQLEANQAGREALILARCALSMSRAQIVSSVHTPWKWRCVGAGRSSENVAGLAESLVPTGSGSNSRRGSREAQV